MTTKVIYLPHFEKPFKHARHYMDSAGNLEQRLTDHRNGNGRHCPICHPPRRPGACRR